MEDSKRPLFPNPPSPPIASQSIPRVCNPIRLRRPLPRVLSLGAVVSEGMVERVLGRLVVRMAADARLRRVVARVGGPGRPAGEEVRGFTGVIIASVLRTLCLQQFSGA